MHHRWHASSEFEQLTAKEIREDVDDESVERPWIANPDDTPLP